MTQLLKQALEKISAVMPDDEQDALARELLAKVEADEKLWLLQFETSTDVLEKLAAEALDDFAKGRTKRPEDL